MQSLSVDEIKQIELNILKNVAEFCDNRNIRYYLGGGTLLGAVRHKGFIPWDDDIDISMPREDYLRFVHEYNGYNDNYMVKSIETDPDYWRTFAKVFDTRTWLKEDVIRVPKKDNAVFIDIFPIDGLPESVFRQFILFREQEFLNFLYHGSAWNYTKSFKYKDSKSRYAELKGVIRTVLKFIAVTVLYPLPTTRLVRLINRNASKYPYKDSKYVGAIVDCAHGAACEKMLREKFEPRIQFEFEGDKFWGPQGYEEYLTSLYGDYNELPPKDKRVTHHDFEAYWK
jgi:lipopolysaccharide cholinephosphotransferase